jgi:4-amino-4-deoxy-L-arabinose transferase-like glycosyltransferase
MNARTEISRYLDRLGLKDWQPPFGLGEAFGGLRGPLLAALLTILAALPCALILPPLDRDESRFAQATSQMLETHDYININYQNTPRHKKPVGIHWLQAAAVKLTSTTAARNIFNYRIPSLLGAALAAFACAWGASKAFGSRTGTKAGILFGITFMLSTEAFIAKTDGVLCGLITLMMAALAQIYLRTRDLDKDEPRPKLRKEKLIFWLAMAAAILVKGPIAPMMLAATIFALWGWDRKIRWARHLGWGWGLILVLAICGPWAVAITITTDGAFWGTAIGGDLASKLEGGSEGHFMWPGYHLALLPVTLFPACWLLGGAAQVAFARRNEAAIRFALCWFLPNFLIFELTPTKLPHYPLPTFAALIWLCAVSLDVPVKGWARIANVAIGLLGGLILTALAFTGQHLYGTGMSLTLAIMEGAASLLIAALAGWLLWRDHPRYGFGFLIAAGVIAHLVIVTLGASLKPIWLSRQMEQALIETHLDPRQGIAPGPVATLGYAEPSFVFTMGTKTQLCNEDARACARALSDGRPVFVEASQEKPFMDATEARGLNPHPLKVIKGHNYNGHDQVITLYDNPPPNDGKQDDGK